MKKYLLAIICMVFYGFLNAQEEKKGDEMKTLFGDGKVVGVHGAFDMKGSPVRGNINLLMGGHGALIFSSNLYLGLAGYGLSTIESFEGVDPNVVESDTANRKVNMDLSMGYGGIIIGYTIAPNSLVHVDIPLFVGVGGARLGNNEISFYDSDFNISPLIENSAFLVVEPGLNVEINLARFCKLGLGGGYRFIYGTELVNLSDSDLSNWTANLSLKFGKFN